MPIASIICHYHAYYRYYKLPFNECKFLLVCQTLISVILLCLHNQVIALATDGSKNSVINFKLKLLLKKIWCFIKGAKYFETQLFVRYISRKCQVRAPELTGFVNNRHFVSFPFAYFTTALQHFCGETTEIFHSSQTHFAS